jgi:hypothetical protein
VGTDANEEQPGAHRARRRDGLGRFLASALLFIGGGYALASRYCEDTAPHPATGIAVALLAVAALIFLTRPRGPARPRPRADIGFDRVYWSSIPRTLAVDRGWPEAGSVFALWPSPVNADACFEEAGFSEFAERGAAWHADFEQLVNLVIEHLEALGPPRVARKPYPQEPEPVADIAHLIIESATATYAEDFVGLLEFGVPKAAALQTGSGHDVLWIWYRDSRLQSLLDALARSWPIERRDLDWQVLLEQYGRTVGVEWLHERRGAADRRRR